MFETSSDSLLLPSQQDEELVNNLLSSDESDCEVTGGDGGGGGGVSLAKALLPLVETPPPLIPWVCSTRYKTELCTTYSSSGFCKYAERCQFAHGLHELHVPSRHPKYKTELCRSFHTAGFCYYGNRCLFVHSPDEQRPALRRRRNVPCRTFRSFGVCPFGTRCNFLHVDDGGDGGGGRPDSPEAEDSPAPPGPPPSQGREWRPRGALCRTFSSFGFCLYGTRCRFQHGLPSRRRSWDAASPGGLPSPGGSGGGSLSSASPGSSAGSSPLPTPSADSSAHNAFTFSSQQLSELLLPLALHLQQLDGGSRAL